MNANASTAVALIGVGQLFDAIEAHWPLVGEGRLLHTLRLTATDDAGAQTAALLASVDPTRTAFFAALDSQAINHARLDVYATARLRGFRAASVRHPSAIVAPDARIGENCWIGAGALLARGVRIGHNTIVSDGVRLDAGAQLGSHGWVGAGASVGARTQVGPHALIGADVRLAADLRIGRHCVVDVPGTYAESLADGTFIDPLFPLPVRIYDGA
ncbi:DapH/DapD/GlmU-related protein [Pseudacidovorax intermedius]|uniref:DapH/DapD/GlmU-related protein n=1 Tax=Pseudacidovorax intermedius TaxID=433924 RepID=UPI000734507D|nr:DapH/DapD/GlmU-related protein [Pseudacidovorax intermedius]